MIELYGLSNCDKVQAAKRWLNQNNIAFHFNDFKENVPDRSLIKEWINNKGLDGIVNKKSTTYRNLPDETRKLLLTEKTATEVIAANLSIIKRPVLVHNKNIIIGFNEKEYSQLKT